jgi:phosphatidylethanolamine/phosphatidyl-N-methylethanolamine N-methyltransferase
LKSKGDPLVTYSQQSVATPLADALRFLGRWAKNPFLIGAVAPSGPFLAKAMAACVDLDREGPVIELGPGTGPVTEALLARVPRERLLLVEYEEKFCDLLAARYPGVKILQGDAYNLRKTLEGHVSGQAAAVVSCLPLLVRPESDRISLLAQAFELMGPQGVLIQFTYGATSPIPLDAPELEGAFVAKGSAPILFNFPPARVWQYLRETPQA